MVEAYPLYWPEGWKRTPEHARKRKYAFNQSFAANRDGLMEELRRLEAKNIVLSTNIPLRRDGLPKADSREPQDPGVAVYFEYKGTARVFACDKYLYARENIRAIALTIDALRGIERWGASDMMERAFQGFLALPEPVKRDWRQVLGFEPTTTPQLRYLETRYKVLAKEHHPDRGGDPEKFREITEAREQARKEIEG
ncbi:MAG TPA: J domain-containing protein [Nitrospirota bacterium]|jgi:hypothetical protein